MATPVKIFFELEPDEDGWPPAQVESVWAHGTDKYGEYIIDNIPFFTRCATLDDTVAARRGKDDRLWFESVVQEGGNSLLRIILLGVDDDLKTITGQLEMLGCAMEYFNSYGLLAVSVPSSCTLTDVLAFLASKEHAGILEYEEAILRQ